MACGLLGTTKKTLNLHFSDHNPISAKVVSGPRLLLPLGLSNMVPLAGPFVVIGRIFRSIGVGVEPIMIISSGARPIMTTSSVFLPIRKWGQVV